MQIVTPEVVAKIASQHDELSEYSIGEDNEGQLIIYTGLYRVNEQSLSMLQLQEGWTKQSG